MFIATDAHLYAGFGGAEWWRSSASVASSCSQLVDAISARDRITTPPHTSERMRVSLTRMREVRIAGSAVVDLVASASAALVLGAYLKLGSSCVAWCLWIVFWVLLGVFVHRALGVHTPLNTALGL